MTPDYRILADRADVTDAIRDRLISISVEDSPGLASDSASIVLDDRDGRLDLPRRGAVLDISLGYRETGLVKIGLYTVDEIGLATVPPTMTIRARAANFRAEFKAPKTRSWDKKTLGDIVRTIAGEAGLDPRIEPGLADINLGHVDQTAESDMHLLTRLAAEVGAVAKPVNGKLLIAPRAATKSIGGKALGKAVLKPEDIATCRIDIADRGRFAQVVARWHDTATGLEREEPVGDGKPAFRIAQRFSDAATARRAAAARLKRFQAGKASGRLSLAPARPEIAAESRLTLTGFRTGIAGDWIVSRATHTLSANGMTTALDIETPPKT